MLLAFSKFSLKIRYTRLLYHKIRRYNTEGALSNKWIDGQEIQSSVKIGETDLTLRSGKLARFADGCAVAQVGDTSVMVTVVGKDLEPNAPLSFLPLKVDYRQKSAAAGRIPTNYLRRDLGQTDNEILTSRIIDRSLRPMFPADLTVDTQLVCNLLAVDSIHDPDIASINAASMALALSDVPWNGPVGAVRVGMIDNEIIINPTRKQLLNSTLNLIVAGTACNKVTMLDASAENISMPLFLKAIKEGLKKTQVIVNTISEIHKVHGKPKRNLKSFTIPDEVETAVKEFAEERIRNIYTDFTHHKISRDKSVWAVRDEMIPVLQERFSDLHPSLLSRAFSSVQKNVFRQLILDTNTRCDGRTLKELRNISCSCDLFKPLHGSALFQRGQTQVMSTVTFDSIESAAKIDTVSSLLGGMKEKNFFLHYEFPPYATNETGRVGAIGRREVGHGALAEKALRPIVPSNYPFTIRLTAEVLESNGSSSLASVCAGSLAMMDAGVPVSKAAAGVAIGLVTSIENNEITDYRIMTDLLGIEDYLGDMDFKIAGTKEGITALQADIKIPGLPMGIITEAVQRGHNGKAEILKIMSECIATPRNVAKENSPVVETLEIPTNKRSKFIGVGGYNIQKLTLETGVTITALEEGKYQLFAPNQSALDEAKEIIDKKLKEMEEPDLEFGAIYQAKIVEIREYGVMVQIHENLQPTLVHNSQLDQRKVNHPSALGMEVGQDINVKYFGRDPASGKVRLSRKVLYAVPGAMPRKLNDPKGIK